jgi:hypothetical protein
MSRHRGAKQPGQYVLLPAISPYAKSSLNDSICHWLRFIRQYIHFLGLIQYSTRDDQGSSFILGMTLIYHFAICSKKTYETQLTSLESSMQSALAGKQSSFMSPIRSSKTLVGEYCEY